MEFGYTVYADGLLYYVTFPNPNPIPNLLIEKDAKLSELLQVNHQSWSFRKTKVVHFIRAKVRSLRNLTQRLLHSE